MLFSKEFLLEARETPWEYGPDKIECEEVEAYTKTITAYRPVNNEKEAKS